MEPVHPVGGGVVELRAVQQAAVQRRYDLGAGQRVDRRAQSLEQVDRNAHRAELQAFEILDLGDRLLEPAERLGRHRPVGQRHDVGADGGVDLGQQRLAAAVLVPGQHHVGVHAEAGARPPERHRVLLAVVVDEHAVAAVEGALGDRVEQAEGRHHRAGGQHLDLEIAAGHVVHFFGEVEGVLVEDVLRAPGALPAEHDRPLGLGDQGESQRGRSGRHGREKASAGDLLLFFTDALLPHSMVLLPGLSGRWRPAAATGAARCRTRYRDRCRVPLEAPAQRNSLRGPALFFSRAG